MPIQETSVEQLSSLSELAPFWRRRLRFCFYTDSHRIDGFVRSSCYRLVDHLNQVKPNGAVRIEEFGLRPLNGAPPASPLYEAGDLDVADIYLAIPEVVRDRETRIRTPQVWTAKRPESVTTNVNGWLLHGTMYLPDDTARERNPIETLPPFVVLTDVSVEGPGDPGNGRPLQVVIVNRQHLDEVHRARAE